MPAGGVPSSGLVSVEPSVAPGSGVPSSGLVGTLGFGAAGASSEPGSGAYCPWLVEAFGSVLAGLSPAAYWSTPLLVGTLEPSPAACSGADVNAEPGS